jgi:alpha,alpha-trehalase
VSLTALDRVGGYLPIEDHGLLGDGSTAALVGRDGTVSWLCLPRFDSQPLFCSILDHARGGGFSLAPEDLRASRQWYEPDSPILVTELETGDGIVRITDLLALREGADLLEAGAAGRGMLIRSAEVLHGRVTLSLALEPRGGARWERSGELVRIHPDKHGDLDLRLASSRPLEGPRARVELEERERFDVVLAWGADDPDGAPSEVDRAVWATREAWQRWLSCFHYSGPQERLVRRSAITLKLLDHFDSGAILAAPTSSLPEAIGGPRNWDYRYTWVRDAAYSVYALRRIGLRREAQRFLRAMLEAIRDDGRPLVLYSLDGTEPPPEWEDPELEGYRGSPPVRWGNAAAWQRQHDVFGEIVDCAYQWQEGAAEALAPLWERLRGLIVKAGQEWREPDHGIWEVRTPGRVFAYSAATCHVALDRGAAMADEYGLPGEPEAWRAEAARIREAILEEAWDEEAGSLTEHLGGGGLDASLLALPLRRVIPARHPRMVATTRAIAERLGAGDGLLYRYDPDISPDGLEGHEGAFLLCSFWLVENLAHQGRVDEAAELYDSLCRRANPLGLLPEQIDPGSGAFLGNYPQAFSHVGVISAGVKIARFGDRGGSAGPGTTS